MALLVLVLVASVAVVLAAPVRVELEVDVAADRPHWSAQVHARWLWFTWRSGGADQARTTRPRPSRRPAARRPRAARRGPRRLLAALKTRGVVRRLCRLAVDMIEALAPRTVDGWVRFGADDPVCTGALFGVAHAVTRLPPTAWNLRLEPEFTGAALAAHARLTWAVRPGAVLRPIGAFVLSSAPWRAAWAALRAR